MSIMDSNETLTIALKEGRKEVTQKYTANIWKNVEKNLSDFDKIVLDMLTAYGTDTIFNFTDNVVKFLGEYLYLKIRKYINYKDADSNIIIKLVDDSPSISNNIKTSKKGKSKKNKKTHTTKGQPVIKKIDQIRLDVAGENITSTIKSIIETFSPHTLTHHTAARSDIMEIRGIGLMYCLWFMCNNKDVYALGGVTNKKYPYALSAIITTEKFLKACDSFGGVDFAKIDAKPKVSASMIADLKAIHKKTKAIYPYDGITICKYAPELLIFSEFDKCIPSQGIAPRKNQKAVIEFVKSNYKTGFLLSYQAMIASGKTTCSMALISFMTHLRKTYKEFNNVQFIFCCNLASVKLQVAQMCWNQKIPFAMAHKESDVAKIINNFNCGNDSDRICIIGSPDAVSLILTDHTKGDPKNMYFLFHDEPTIGADLPCSQSLRDNVLVMSNLPKWTILSSATMPSLENLPVFTNKFKLSHPGAIQSTVYSDEIQIGCDLKTTSGDLVIPHMGCTDSTTLKKIISTIKINPFLGRIYTQNVATTVWTECTKLGVAGIPDIPEEFRNVNNLSADSIRQYAINMLEIVSEQPDNIITAICSSPIFDGVVNTEISGQPDAESTQEPYDDFWEDSAKKNEVIRLDDPVKSIDYTKFGTTHAYRFLQPNLITTHDPLTFAVEQFADLLEYVKTNTVCPVHSAKNIIGKYKRQLARYQEDIDRLEKRIEDEDVLSLEICKKQEDKPKLQFPATAQINTVHHINKFAKEHIEHINSRFVRSEVILEDLPYDTFNVPDNILQLLFCGVGIYSPGHKMLDKNYTDTVLTLADTGSLAFIVADSSICYGTNYPINRVFVVKDFSQNTSIGTWFQTMGRAGRVNRSWTAEAYVDESCAQDIIRYAHNPDAFNSETINMITMFKMIEEEKKDAIIKDIAKMKSDIEEEMTKKNTSGPSIRIIGNNNNNTKHNLDNNTKHNVKHNLDNNTKHNVDNTKMKLLKVGDVVNTPLTHIVKEWQQPEWRSSTTAPVHGKTPRNMHNKETHIDIFNKSSAPIKPSKSDALSWRKK